MYVYPRIPKTLYIFSDTACDYQEIWVPNLSELSGIRKSVILDVPSSSCWQYCSNNTALKDGTQCWIYRNTPNPVLITNATDPLFGTYFLAFNDPRDYCELFFLENGLNLQMTASIPSENGSTTKYYLKSCYSGWYTSLHVICLINIVYLWF